MMTLPTFTSAAIFHHLRLDVQCMTGRWVRQAIVQNIIKSIIIIGCYLLACHYIANASIEGEVQRSNAHSINSQCHGYQQWRIQGGCKAWIRHWLPTVLQNARVHLDINHSHRSLEGHCDVTSLSSHVTWYVSGDDSTTKQEHLRWRPHYRIADKAHTTLNHAHTHTWPREAMWQLTAASTRVGDRYRCASLQVICIATLFLSRSMWQAEHKERKWYLFEQESVTWWTNWSTARQVQRLTPCSGQVVTVRKHTTGDYWFHILHCRHERLIASSHMWYSSHSPNHKICITSYFNFLIINCL